MKTIKEWFKELPEEYREEALTELHKEVENDTSDSLSSALAEGFFWVDRYIWEKRYEELYSKGL